MTLTADSADSEAVSEGGECCREEIDDEELDAALEDSYLPKMRGWVNFIWTKWRCESIEIDN